MKTLPASALLISVLLLGAAAPSFSASPAQVRKEIQAAYAAMDQAIIRKDVDAAAEYMTPDFEEIRPNGQTADKEAFRGDMEKALSVATPDRRSRTVLQKVQIVPGGVVVTNTSEDTLYVPSPQDGRTHTIRIVGTSRDFWVHTDEGWRLKRSRDLTARTTLDGRALRVPAFQHRTKKR